jgi:putative hemolysin
MGDPILDIAVIFALCLLNGFFAMAELAVVASNKNRLAFDAAKGNTRAAKVLALHANSAAFFATVQVGITLVGIIAGAFGGATVAETLGTWLIQRGVGERIAEPVAFVTVVGAITYLSLILGELVPKQIALEYPERVAGFMASPLVILARMARPVVWLLETSSNLITKFLPFKVGSRSEVSEADIHHAIAAGAATGEIKRTEHEIAQRLFLLDDRPIRAFMTPRPDVVWMDTERSFEQNMNRALSVPHTFFPIAEGGLDKFIGVVSIKELVALRLTGSNADLRRLARPIQAIPSSKNTLAVLEDFKAQRKQLAMVVDEHGGVAGLVTTHDLFEALVGDLADFEGEAPRIVTRSDGSLLVDAGVDLQDLLIHLDRSPLSEGEGLPYDTVGGLIYGQLVSFPKEGDRVTWNSLEFEVIDLDGQRIDKLLVRTHETHGGIVAERASGTSSNEK